MTDKLKGLYVITDETICRGKTHIQIAQEALRGGAKIIQLRDKYANDRYFYQTALKVRELCKNHNALFIINDRVHIALAVCADGVNIGQNDMPCKEVRKILGNDKIIGVSASTLEEAYEAEKDGADYIGWGPVFRTDTKKDYECITGADTVSLLKNRIKVPIAAIGGINAENINLISRLGADMCCVVSAVVMQDDMKKATEYLIEKINNS